MKIYVASSWKNTHYLDLLQRLRDAGHEPLDWRVGGFGWRETGVSQETMTAQQYRDEVLLHPRACEGFKNDFDKMNEADCCVLLLPCGRSAHLEAGWFWGHAKPMHIYIPIFDTPELMYKGADSICFTIDELLHELRISAARLSEQASDQAWSAQSTLTARTS